MQNCSLASYWQLNLDFLSSLLLLLGESVGKHGKQKLSSCEMISPQSPHTVFREALNKSGKCVTHVHAWAAAFWFWCLLLHSGLWINHKTKPSFSFTEMWWKATSLSYMLFITSNLDFEYLLLRSADQSICNFFFFCLSKVSLAQHLLLQGSPGGEVKRSPNIGL